MRTDILTDDRENGGLSVCFTDGWSQYQKLKPFEVSFCNVLYINIHWMVFGESEGFSLSIDTVGADLIYLPFLNSSCACFGKCQNLIQTSSISFFWNFSNVFLCRLFKCREGGSEEEIRGERERDEKTGWGLAHLVILAWGKSKLGLV